MDRVPGGEQRSVVLRSLDMQLRMEEGRAIRSALEYRPGEGRLGNAGDRVVVLRLACERYGARVGRVGFKSLIDNSLLNAKRLDAATTDW